MAKEGLKDFVRDAIVAGAAGAAISKIGGGSGGTAGGGNSSKRGGCAIIVAVLLIVGLIGLLFQKIGCVCSEDALREGTAIKVTGVETIPEKNLVAVNYTVKNSTRWAETIELEWLASKTTGTHIASNRVNITVSGNKEVSERVMFELADFDRNGIKDPKDRDICKIEPNILKIKEVDSPNN